MPIPRPVYTGGEEASLMAIVWSSPVAFSSQSYSVRST